MNAEGLKAIQAPLKEKYKQDPQSAVITLRAEGRASGLTCKVETGVGFRDIRLTFELDTDASEEQKASLLKLTERYCVVLQTLRAAPPVTARIGGQTGG